ncbi:zinc finger protein RFP-like isoform X2 [Rhineura floridana]|uniref:zinc finger protein RFP-like isoform X2 n=1 Tax=Rhineura floridana TaxID=261503 RepID=UPI002AC860D7|nr:zinc finger protein RFP-like isoform X2 [Rhineura floridana]
MAESILKQLQWEATCSFCRNYFKDPVILECGHIFCHLCILSCWKSFSTRFVCPQCKQVASEVSFKPSRQLVSVVGLIEQLSYWAKHEAARRAKICEMHQQALRYFCKDNQSLICLVCDGSMEHQYHNVVPLEEAAREYKMRTAAERQKTMVKYQELHQFLIHQQHFLLTKMDEVEDEIAKKRDEHMGVLFEELFSLNRIIRELEDKCQQPADEFLQDIKSIWRRLGMRKKFKRPVVYPPALKWNFWELFDLNAFLVGAVKQFEDILVSGYQLLKANVTLDPDTAPPNLLVSKNCKALRSTSKRQHLLNLHKRFDECNFVLGCEEFTAGRHYWEAAVGKEEEWGLGIARRSVRRKGLTLTSTENGIWAVGKWGGKYRSLGCPFHRLALSGELKRIRVSLNYDGGRMAFFDADRADLLFEFPVASFAGEPVYPFFWLQRKAQIRLLP